MDIQEINCECMDLIHLGQVWAMGGSCEHDDEAGDSLTNCLAIRLSKKDSVAVK